MSNIEKPSLTERDVCTKFINPALGGRTCGTSLTPSFFVDGRRVRLRRLTFPVHHQVAVYNRLCCVPEIGKSPVFRNVRLVDSRRLIEFGVNAALWYALEDVLRGNQEKRATTMASFEAAFQEICDACGQYPSIKGGLQIGDPRAQAAIVGLKVIADWLRQRFSEFRGNPITVVISEGVGAFPRVPWVCLLPHGQSVSHGIYVGICFGKGGNGAVVGCMQSVTSPQGLKTERRSARLQTPVIDVDGAREGTRYNNAFVNPKEILRDAVNPDFISKHIENSLSLAMDCIEKAAVSQQGYSSTILRALTNEPAGSFGFQVDREKGRNAAACLTSLLCRRLAAAGDTPMIKSRTTYDWAGGLVNLRNAIRAPQVFWTNIRVDYAKRIHEENADKEIVYLMSLWNPSDTSIHVWAIPEAVLLESLSRLPVGQIEEKRTIKIRPHVPAFENDPNPVNLSPYYRSIELLEKELFQLRKANEIDLLVRERSERPDEEFIDDVQPLDVEGNDESDILDGQLDASDVYRKEDALDGLFMTERQLDLILSRLRRKMAVILQGPPGVGKTFVASRLAFTLMGKRDDRRVKTIQFHPSYGYEDFVQGYRPTGAGLERHDGILVQFARLAQKEPELEWFLVIDEINRGNLAKIFGELLMLIEADKRGTAHAIPLTYSLNNNETFYLPDNLYIIGTMNTADRSLSMVDYALRRRFAFVNLEPAFDSPSFSSWMTDRGVSDELIAQIRQRIGELNEVIAKERDLGPGFRIGHSFFCSPTGELNDAWYREIVEGEIQPLLEEYFESRDRVNQLVADLFA